MAPYLETVKRKTYRHQYRQDIVWVPCGLGTETWERGGPLVFKMVDDEGFQVVKKGKRRKNETVRCKVDIPSTLCNGILPEGEEYNLNEIRGRIEKCRHDMECHCSFL